MDRKLELILGNEHIFNWFGYWPSFHDAEIHWIKLQRAVPLRGNSANIELMTHTWELTDQKDQHGHLVTQKHCLVHLRFENCREVQIDNFNFQNALFELGFTINGVGQEKHLQITLDASDGVSGSFMCDHVEVWRVIPCNKEGVSLSS